MDYLQLEGKRFVVMGVANRKSVAYFIGKSLESNGAKVEYVVRSQKRRDEVSKLFPTAPIWICDVEEQTQIDDLARQLAGNAITEVQPGAFASISALQVLFGLSFIINFISPSALYVLLGRSFFLNFISSSAL
jgi:enoyl-[acyl-carrier protein] reductase I